MMFIEVDTINDRTAMERGFSSIQEMVQKLGLMRGTFIIDPDAEPIDSLPDGVEHLGVNGVYTFLAYRYGSERYNTHGASMPVWILQRGRNLDNALYFAPYGEVMKLF